MYLKTYYLYMYIRTMSDTESDTESENSQYSDTDSEYSKYSDTVREDIDAKHIFREKFMSYKCRDCEMLKLPIKQGFLNGVCDNTCQCMICDNCNKTINEIDDMNSKYINSRNVKNLDEDLEIFVFIKMNKFLTEEEFGNLLYKGDEEGNDNDFIYKYYNLVKRLYGMSLNIRRLMKEAMNDNDFDFISCEYKAHELRYTVISAIRTMGWFKKEIGNNIYNEKLIK